MPRNKTGVKNKTRRSFSSSGLIDLHFHGAFGIDLMKARESELNELSSRLAQAGVAGFCPTTLSAPARELQETVARVGAWIRSERAPGALPLGIHLEGPFLHPDACGAHPPSCLRPARLDELERLWRSSQGTLKILTLAPELLEPDPGLEALVRWSTERGIRLSLGHTRATEAQARHAFEAGFSGVTHAWNALPFHHRAPGPLGAALGRPDTYVELIIDRIHVAPEILRWTRALHPRGFCLVSDCAPAAATSDGRWCSFGPLKARFQDGACRLENGSLAGGGVLLPEALRSWLTHEAATTATEATRLLRAWIPGANTYPLRALGLRPAEARALSQRASLGWEWRDGGPWALSVRTSQSRNRT